MNNLAKISFCAAASALGLAVPAVAGTATMTFLPSGFGATDISADGSVVVGNVGGDGSYETFRWTEAGGAVRLGRATFPVIGEAAGTPDVSYDGTRVSATILDDTDSFATQGVWFDGAWTVAIPPTAPNGATLGLSAASAWGLSGSGEHITGFYFTNLGYAHPSIWSSISGLTPLDVEANRNARVNGTNFDGTVSVGWHERPDGTWQPTAWRDGVRMTLANIDWFTGCEQVTADGTKIIGQSFNPGSATREAALWTWNGSSYDEQVLGVLPGTAVGFGQSGAQGISDDGEIIVGYNLFSFTPFSNAAPWIWTPSTGMVAGTDFIASLGITLDPDLYVFDFSGISADGSTILGNSLNVLNGKFSSFVLKLPPDCPASSCVGDINGDSVVDTADLGLLIGAFGSDDACNDINGDGIVDTADLGLLIGQFGGSCGGA